MSDKRFVETLDELRRRVRWKRWYGRVSGRALIWLAVALAFLCLDAAWTRIGAYFADDPYAVYELPIWWRAVVSGGLGIALLGGIGRFFLPGCCPDCSRTEAARLAEEQLAITDGHLVDAAQLADRDDEEPLPSHLRRRVLARAGETVAPLALRRIAPPAWQPITSMTLIAVVIAIALVPPLFWSPIRELSQWHPVGRTVWRYVEPLSDHPPAGPVTITAPADALVGMPESYRWTRDGDYRAGAFVYGREPRRARLTIVWDDGGRQTHELNGEVTDGAVWFDHVVSSVDQPFRYTLHAANSRSRRRTVTPKVVPAIEQVRLTLQHAGRNYPLTFEPGGTIRAAIGSQLLIEVEVTPESAVLTRPDADGTSLAVPIPAGRQVVELDLIMPDGARSRYGRSIEIIGLPQSEIDRINAELAEEKLADDTIGLPVAADALAGAVAVGSPERATAAELADGRPTEDEPTGGEPRENGAGGSGEGTGGVGDGADPPPLVDAVGVLAARYDVTGEELRELRRLVSAAPPAYRDLVAEYLLKLRERE